MNIVQLDTSLEFPAIKVTSAWVVWEEECHIVQNGNESLRIDGQIQRDNEVNFGFLSTVTYVNMRRPVTVFSATESAVDWIVLEMERSSNRFV
jgi:hypothetical protein